MKVPVTLHALPMPPCACSVGVAMFQPTPLAPSPAP